MANNNRMRNIISTSPALKRTYNNQVTLTQAQSTGTEHAKTGGSLATGDLRVTVSSQWAAGVSDNRLKATLYHEGVHVQQRSRPGFMDVSTKSVREFHAHTEELRKATKHDLYTPTELQQKRAKIDKYYQKVVAEGTDVPLLQAQYQRIQSGETPRKITTKRLHKALEQG